MAEIMRKEGLVVGGSLIAASASHSYLPPSYIYIISSALGLSTHAHFIPILIVGVGNGAHINWSVVTCQGSTRLELPCLRFTGPAPADSRQ